MAKFSYRNKVSTHFTLTVEGKPTEFSLHDGDTIDLPEGNEFIQLLIKQGKLVAVPKETKKQITKL